MRCSGKRAMTVRHLLAWAFHRMRHHRLSAEEAGKDVRAAGCCYTVIFIRHSQPGRIPWPAAGARLAEEHR